MLKVNLDCSTAVLNKVMQQIKVMAEASNAEAHKHGIRRKQRKAAVADDTEELERGSKTQEPPGARASRGERFQ